MIVTSVTDLAHCILRQLVHPGDAVVDATLGNGNDTMLLRELVGRSGKVYAFDIQSEAIAHARTRIPVAEQDNIEWILDSHARLNRYVHDSVRAVVFNLGYLPGADHSISTAWASTKLALEQSLERICVQGAVIIAAYLGHDHGAEYGALKAYLSELSPRDFKVSELCAINQSTEAPRLLLCQRVR